MDFRDRDVEASLPVQSRISLITLANLDIYWTRSGYNIATMSRLVSWSLELLWEILVANNQGKENITTAAEADRYLEMRGLRQKSLKKKGIKKLSTAISFESLRQEGVDPRNYVPQQHKMLHRSNSVKGFTGEVRAVSNNLDIIEEAIEKARRMKEEERERELEEATQGHILKEKMSDAEMDEYEEYQRKKDEEQLRLLNELDEIPFVDKVK